jgi:putative phosphotransacetylase
MPQSDREKLVDRITELVLKDIQREIPKPTAVQKTIIVPVGISHRHLHICQPDLEVLFGKGYQLRIRNQLSQPNEFAAYETVTLVGPKLRALEGVRILGPPRTCTQVEIALTDGYYVGIEPPVRASGDIDGTPGVTVVGPKGTLILEKGVIRANRHIHASEDHARSLSVNNRQIVTVLARRSDKPLLFQDVMIRVSRVAFFELHLDTDDGNAAGLHTGDLVELLL